MYNEQYTTADRLASPTLATCEKCGNKYTMHVNEVPTGKPFYCTHFPACAEKREQTMADENFKVSDFGYEGDPNEIMAYAKGDVNDSAPVDDAGTGTSPADPNAGDKDAPKDADGNPVPPTPAIPEDQLGIAPGADVPGETPEYVENTNVTENQHDDGIDTPVSEGLTTEHDPHVTL